MQEQTITMQIRRVPAGQGAKSEAPEQQLERLERAPATRGAEVTASQQTIVLQAEQALAGLSQLERLVQTLVQQCYLLSHELSQLRSGDPRGYLRAGLEHGLAVVRASLAASAAQYALLRNARATIVRLAQADHLQLAQEQKIKKKRPDIMVDAGPLHRGHSIFLER